MLAKDAPAAAAIRWPSPVLCGGLHLAAISASTYSATISASHSNPPQASTTPRAARSRRPSTSTPVTARSPPAPLVSRDVTRAWLTKRTPWARQ